VNHRLDLTPDIRNEVTVLPDDLMRLQERISLNRLPDISDWEAGGRLSDIMRELRQPVCVHRKSWEYALAIAGLEKFGLVTPEARAIAVGAGYESPLYYFANRIAMMVATDLYQDPEHEGKPEMLMTPERFAPFEYRRDHLEVHQMSGTDLRFADNSFDFAFCLSSIEHFGPRASQTRCLDEVARVLKPGGVFCCITELILTRGHTHFEYFSFEELTQIFLKRQDYELVGGAPDYRISESMVRYPVDPSQPGSRRSPHIVLRRGDMKWTSFSMFLRRK
jgi:SAM-dependent methyltransferase